MMMMMLMMIVILMMMMSHGLRELQYCPLVPPQDQVGWGFPGHPATLSPNFPLRESEHRHHRSVKTLAGLLS
jgi:hypothetical protein